MWLQGDIEGALKKNQIKNMNIPLETHFPKGIEPKSFHGQTREIFPEILREKN